MVDFQKQMGTLPGWIQCGKIQLHRRQVEEAIRARREDVSEVEVAK